MSFQLHCRDYGQISAIDISAISCQLSPRFRYACHASRLRHFHAFHWLIAIELTLI